MGGLTREPERYVGQDGPLSGFSISDGAGHIVSRQKLVAWEQDICFLVATRQTMIFAVMCAS